MNSKMYQNLFSNRHILPKLSYKSPCDIGYNMLSYKSTQKNKKEEKRGRESNLLESKYL